MAYVSGVFQPGLDIRLFPRFRVPSNWHQWLLPTDPHVVDISAFAYRCMRVIGGSWTERLHSDSNVQEPRKPLVSLSRPLLSFLPSVGAGRSVYTRIPISKNLANRWSHLADLSCRTCPLCHRLLGTPRHVIIPCPSMLPLVEVLRDDMEVELLRLSTLAIPGPTYSCRAAS